MGRPLSTPLTRLHHEAGKNLHHRTLSSVLLCPFPFIRHLIQLTVVTILSALATHFGGWVNLHTWHNLPEIHFLVFDVHNSFVSLHLITGCLHDVEYTIHSYGQKDFSY